MISSSSRRKSLAGSVTNAYSPIAVRQYILDSVVREPTSAPSISNPTDTRALGMLFSRHDDLPITSSVERNLKIKAAQLGTPSRRMGKVIRVSFGE